MKKEPDDLPEEVVKTIQAAVVTGFQALHLRDYARFDFRITLDHKAYLIEANPNPYLYSGAEFVKAARASGAAPAASEGEHSQEWLCHGRLHPAAASGQRFTMRVAHCR